jgi:hypothetical protein
MRGRAVQLVCLVLLLSSLSAADASTLRPNPTNLHRIGAFFAEANRQTATDATTHSTFSRPLTLDAPASHSVPVAAALPMRPAALYTAATHAVTGSSL